MTDFEALVDQVLDIDNSKDRHDVLIDLKYTKSVEATINRIFDGQFLKGTLQDPLEILNQTSTEQFIVLDSDEEEPSANLLQDDLFSLSSSQPIDESVAVDDLPSLPAPEEVSPVFANPDILEINSSLSKQSNSLLDLDDLPSLSPVETTMSDSLVLKDTRQNDLDSLPSAIDFFDELISQKRDTPVVEIDDDDYMNYNNHDDEQPSIERKGKRKATEDIIPAKEKKRLEVEERKQQRANIAEAKRIQKEQNALEKKRLKEQKQLEKEKATLLEKENRLRLDRTQILQEMLIDIHPTFLQSKQGQLLEASLKAKEAHLRDLTAYETLPNYTIGWRRQCQSEWDQGSQAFLPLEKVKIIKEPVILIFLDALAFIQHLQEDTLDQLVSSLEKPGRQTMMLIEGLDGYYKKKMIMTRRAFASQVLQTDNRPRKQTNSTNQVIAEGPCKEEVEEALAYLQLMRDVMLVTTKDAQDTVSWIESLTIDLGLGRYKSKNLNTTFKVSKCGHNAHDTFYKMLQEVQLCTPAIAGSIMKHYPTVQSLHHAYRSTHSASEAEMMLADLEVERSALQTRDRKINRVMSRKMHTIFTDQDAEQIIY